MGSEHDAAPTRPGAAAAPVRDPVPAARTLPARALELQRAVGNRAARTTLARWRDFNAARGEAQYDYKIVQGHHATAGAFHLKFHNVEQMGVFDEIHVVFEQREPRAYYFFTDAGALIPAKSNNDAALGAIAKELVDEQLQTSGPVAADVVAGKRKERADQEAKDLAQKKKWAEEEEAKRAAAEAKEAEAREASKAAADEEQHMLNFLADYQLGAGELPSFKAYVGGTGQARGYWKEKADWYKAHRGAWSVELKGERLKKGKSVTAEDVRTKHNLPASANVAVKSTKSGQYVVWTPKISFPNYTTYAASKLGDKPG